MSPELADLEAIVQKRATAARNIAEYVRHPMAYNLSFYRSNLISFNTNTAILQSLQVPEALRC